jgi:hypothetical protein
MNQSKLLQRYLGMDVKLVLTGSDMSLLMSAGKAHILDIWLVI